ncbi:hypothetical protein L3Q82_002746 [Scortum barcoo]|uniref:Uncharacterized protein n=1 Tax=Scortum barcoo TaxID=214431 RepID=A0ACB8VUT2_9TELE|nr:hypothetical protein L3Q82_002746 [Scortum barcoo]
MDQFTKCNLRRDPKPCGCSTGTNCPCFLHNVRKKEMFVALHVCLLPFSNPPPDAFRLFHNLPAVTRNCLIHLT